MQRIPDCDSFQGSRWVGLHDWLYMQIIRRGFWPETATDVEHMHGDTADHKSGTDLLKVLLYA